MSSRNEENLSLLPPDERAKLLEENPYRRSRWFHPTPHEGYNSTYVRGFVRGKFYVMNELLEFMRVQKIPKESMRAFFAKVLGKSDFGTEINENEENTQDEDTKN